MALTGLEIYKNLPKTNCKDCGFPTCLAFAMKMATKQVSLDKCPHVTAAAKAALGGAVRYSVTLGQLQGNAIVLAGAGCSSAAVRAYDVAMSEHVSDWEAP